MSPHVRPSSRAFVGRVTAALIVGASITAGSGFKPAPHRSLANSGVPGLSFRLSSSVRVFTGDAAPTQDNEVMRGRGVAANDHSHLEFLAYTPAPNGITTDDYLIGGDSGKTYIFHSGSQTFADANDTFGGPGVVALGRVMGGGGAGAGRGAGGRGPGGPGGGGGGAGRANRGGGGGGGGGGAAGGRGRGRGRGSVGQGFLSQIQLLDVNFKLEDLGAADSIEGRATHHYRVTADYRVVWGDEALPAHAVTELWTTNLPTKIPNPFEPLIVADQSTDGPLIEYALKLRSVRAQIEGTPIKVVTSTVLSGIHNIIGFQSFVGDDPTIDTLHIIQQTQITNIQAADVDPKQVMVPEANGE